MKLLLQKKTALILALAAGIGHSARGAGEDWLRAEIHFSNGKMALCEVRLAPEARLTLLDGQAVHKPVLSELRELRFVPEKEKMERKWRFVEAGQTRKEEWGEPYPVRHLRAAALLSDGRELKGHLFAVPLYLRGEDGETRLLLGAKQRGKEGETFADLVYPARLVFLDAASAATSGVARAFEAPAGVGANAQAAALAWSSLSRFEARPTAGTSRFELPSSLGGMAFPAVLGTECVWVGWPVKPDVGLAEHIAQALPGVRDFFDERRVVAAFRDAENSDVYTLMRLWRAGQTTLDAERNRPWRIEVWRWKEQDNRLLLAGRGWLFRGIETTGGEPPEVRISRELWDQINNGLANPD